MAGDFSRQSSATSVTTLWGKNQPALSIGVGDYSYANFPPSNWCTAFWNIAVGSRDGFLAVGDHDTYYGDRLTNDTTYGYWESATGYANSCGLKGSGVSWVGSGTVSNNHACNTSTNIALFDTCFGREMYVDYPLSTPLVRFIVLCDGIASRPNATAWCDYGPTGTDAMNHFTWLDSIVKAGHDAGIRWVVVLNHVYDWAAGPYGISYSDELWNHLINDKVDLLISGDEHNYERSYPLTCQKTSGDNWYQNKNGPIVQSCIGDTNASVYEHGEGLLYLISGTGGQTLNRFNTTNVDWLSNSGYFSALNDTTQGFNLFTVTSTTISDVFTPAVGSFSDNWSISYPSAVGGTLLGVDWLAPLNPYLESVVLIGAILVIVIVFDRRKQA